MEFVPLVITNAYHRQLVGVAELTAELLDHFDIQCHTPRCVTVKMVNEAAPSVPDWVRARKGPYISDHVYLTLTGVRCQCSGRFTAVDVLGSTAVAQGSQVSIAEGSVVFIYTVRDTARTSAALELPTIPDEYGFIHEYFNDAGNSFSFVQDEKEEELIQVLDEAAAAAAIATALITASGLATAGQSVNHPDTAPTPGRTGRESSPNSGREVDASADAEKSTGSTIHSSPGQDVDDVTPVSSQGKRPHHSLEILSLIDVTPYRFLVHYRQFPEQGGKTEEEDQRD